MTKIQVIKREAGNLHFVYIPISEIRDNDLNPGDEVTVVVNKNIVEVQK